MEDFFFFRWSGREEVEQREVGGVESRNRRAAKDPSRTAAISPTENSSSAASARTLSLFLTVKIVAGDRPRKGGSRSGCGRRQEARRRNYFSAATPCLREEKGGRGGEQNASQPREPFCSNAARS